MSNLADKSIVCHMITFQDLSNLIQTDTTCDRQRRERLTAIRMLVRIISRCAGAGPLQASAIRCDVSWLNEHLFKLPPKAHGLKQSSFGNVITHLRKILRQLDLLDAESGSLPEGSVWRRVVDSLNEAECRYGLSRFAAWCQAAAIPPTSVTSETLVAFELHLRTRHLRPDIPGFIGNLVKNWRKAAVISAAWPSARIDAPPRKKLYEFEVSDFPSAVQAMVGVYQRRLSGEGRRGPFSSDGPPLNLRSGTVEKRVYGLKLALNAYVEINKVAPLQVTDLAQLLEPVTFQAILMFFWERAVEQRIAAGELDPSLSPDMDAGNTSYTASVATALMILAKYVCPRSDEELVELSSLAASVSPTRQTSISRRNTAILDRLLEPKIRFAVLRLPVKLMKEADAMIGQPRKAALIAMTAVAIEIELNKPLRLTNLTRLRLGEELQFTDPRVQRPTKLKIRSQDVKNAVDIEWPISEQLGNLIAHYLRYHRANLGAPGTVWLFPGERPDGSRHPGTIRAGIKDIFAEHIGIHVHPHIFRAFVAYLILEANPGALEDLRQLLDHKSLQTSLVYYSYRKRDEVASRVDRVLERERTIRAPEKLSKSPKVRVRRSRR